MIMFDRSSLDILVLWSVHFLQAIAHFRDHVIIWNPGNRIFRAESFRMEVNEGDNIVFRCPEWVNGSFKLHWTPNHRYFNACDWPESKPVQPLMTCNSFGQTSEFILKVSQFSELNYVPNFRRGYPIYFVAGKKLCKEAHMKITVELKSSDKPLHNSTSGDFPPTKRAGVKKVDKQMHINNSRWEIYGFLVVPGSLALMILICLPTMLCSSCLFWSCKKRFKRYPKQRKPNYNEEDDLDANEAGSAAACSLCQELATEFDENHFDSTNNPEPIWAPMRVTCDPFVWRAEQPALSTNENSHNTNVDYRFFQSHCTEQIFPVSLYKFPQNHHMMEDSPFKPVRLQTHLNSIAPLYQRRSQERTRVRF